MNDTKGLGDRCMRTQQGSTAEGPGPCCSQEVSADGITHDCVAAALAEQPDPPKVDTGQMRAQETE